MGFNNASFNGVPFWSGCVSLVDGVIEEVHSYEEADEMDFHHSLYFSQSACERMEKGESAFFCIGKDGAIEGDWRECIPKNILNTIESQLDRIDDIEIEK